MKIFKKITDKIKSIRSSKEDDKLKNTSSTTVRIKVLRLLGNNVPMTIALFNATQQRDSSFNLQLVSEDNSFKKDVTIVEDEIIETLKYRLNQRYDNETEKIVAIENKISEQETKIKRIKDGIYKNKDNKEEIVNIIDEQNFLKQLKVLKFHVINEGAGSFESIGFDGIREMSFLYHDGMTIPYFIKSPVDDKEGKEILTMHPAIGSKVKHHKSEQDILDREFIEEQQGEGGRAWNNFLKIVVVGLVIVNIFWSVQNSKRANELTKVVDEGYIQKLVDMVIGSDAKCTYALAEQLANNKEVLEWARSELINRTVQQRQESQGRTTTLDELAKKALAET